MSNPVAMKELFHWLDTPSVKLLFSIVEEAGGELRVVGGAIRDALMGKQATEIDFAVTLDPDLVMSIMRSKGLKVVPTGIKHGTVTIVMNGRGYEVTTLRRDVETDGRRSKVVFVDSWQEDASRRDFTINAMYVDAEGNLWDYLGSRQDIETKTIRFIGDPELRIREDVLRILRAYRFMAQIDGAQIDPATEAACVALCDQLVFLSVERVWKELSGILSSVNPAPVLKRMAKDGVLQVVLPEFIGLGRLQELIMIDSKGGKLTRAVRRLACLVDQKSAPLMCKRLKLSKAEARHLLSLTMAMDTWPVIERLEQLDQFLYDHGAVLVGDVLCYQHALDRDYSVFKELTLHLETWSRPVFPLSGHDLMAIGVRDGKRVGEILGIVETWWRQARFLPDHSACLDAARRASEFNEIAP